MTKEQELKNQIKEKTLARRALSNELNSIKDELKKYYAECNDKAVADGFIKPYKYPNTYESDNVLFYFGSSGIEAIIKNINDRGTMRYCNLKTFINRTKKLENPTYSAEATKLLKYLK